MKALHCGLAAGLLGLAAGSAATFAATVASLPSPIPGMGFERVLDGDTVVDYGRAVHIRGVDAPELGPWAQCWAEASLAGAAKNALESILLERRYRLINVRNYENGHLEGNLIDPEGYDIADELRVGGFAAASNSKWDWCGAKPTQISIDDGKISQIAPNLWWPSNQMYDPRAAD
jgi:endonuclease YncB( thermonuclease family)